MGQWTCTLVFVVMFVYFLLFEKSVAPLHFLYTYALSHLGAAQHNRGLPTLASKEFLCNCQGLIVLLKGISAGIVVGGDRVSH